jgi:YbbR domain-containing protein
MATTQELKLLILVIAFLLAGFIWLFVTKNRSNGNGGNNKTAAAQKDDGREDKNA